MLLVSTETGTRCGGVTRCCVLCCVCCGVRCVTATHSTNPNPLRVCHTEHRRRAAELLSTLAGRQPEGVVVRQTVMALTTPQLSSELTQRPEVYVELVDSDHRVSDSAAAAAAATAGASGAVGFRVWDSAARDKLRDFLSTEVVHLCAGVGAGAGDSDVKWDGASDRWKLHDRVCVLFPELAPKPTPAPASAPGADTPVSAAAAAVTDGAAAPAKTE